MDFSLKSILLAILWIIVIDGSTLVLNNSQNISYQLNNSCDILTSSVSNEVRCLILCQTILCQRLDFNVNTNNCTLYYGRPDLIQHDSLPGLNITYILNSYISFGQSCLFNFTCITQSCFNGFCCSFDTVKYSQGLAYEWRFNNTLIDDIQCTVLTPQGNVTFENDSSVYLSNGAYLQAPSVYYFDRPFSISAWFGTQRFFQSLLRKHVYPVLGLLSAGLSDSHRPSVVPSGSQPRFQLHC